MSKKNVGQVTAIDVLVDTPNPALLDTVIQQWGAALVGGGMPEGFAKQDDYCIMRVFGDAEFLKFVIENQGYGRVIA